MSLRAHTRIAGVNAAGNTSHGVRVSTRLAKNAQVAMQDGRFVLRGRYGGDAAKVNLSKTGVTVSTRTPSGTLNWIKPGRSSFKLAGVQIRGKKAVWFLLAHLLITVVIAVVKLTLQVVLAAFALLASGITAAVQWLWLRRAAGQQRALLAALDPGQAEALARQWLAKQSIDLEVKSGPELLGALGYCLVSSGRGERRLESSHHEANMTNGTRSPVSMKDIAAAEQVFGAGLPDGSASEFPLLVLGLMLRLAGTLDPQLDGDMREEALLALDDACLAGGPKTMLQEAMIDALAECWRIRLVFEGEG